MSKLRKVSKISGDNIITCLVWTNNKQCGKQFTDTVEFIKHVNKEHYKDVY